MKVQYEARQVVAVIIMLILIKMLYTNCSIFSIFNFCILLACVLSALISSALFLHICLFSLTRLRGRLPFWNWLSIHMCWSCMMFTRITNTCEFPLHWKEPHNCALCSLHALFCGWILNFGAGWVLILLLWTILISYSSNLPFHLFLLRLLH